jgi:hypothetical protein
MPDNAPTTPDYSATASEFERLARQATIGTAGRPQALLQVTRFQCDLGRGTINVHPPGRTQTKKRRPILPNSRTTGRYIHVAPERLASARKALDEIASEIGRVAARPISPETMVRASALSHSYYRV